MFMVLADDIVGVACQCASKPGPRVTPSGQYTKVSITETALLLTCMGI